MIAAQRDTSVSALVKAFLVELTSGEKQNRRFEPWPGGGKDYHYQPVPLTTRPSRSEAKDG